MTLLLPILVCSLASSSALARQESQPAPLAETDELQAGEAELPPLEAFRQLGIELVDGPTQGLLGQCATIDVPEGFVFTAGDGARRFLELNQNPTGGNELGMFAKPDFSWFVVFEFDEDGYVEDDERDELDANALLASLRAGNEAGNEERQRRGWETLELTGWMVAPHYDPASQNLEWALELRSSGGGESINHNTRILGRKGVMVVTLVTGPGDFAAALPAFREVIGGFDYVAGERYSEYVEGDKIAEYGLAALVAGGAGVLAAKTGLLGKLWKFILIGLVAVGALVKKLFGFGGKKSESETNSTSA